MDDILSFLEILEVLLYLVIKVAVHKTGFTKQELWQLPCKGC